MNVVWTEPASADLHAIQAYIARRSARYALDLVERIVSSSELLADQPLLGRRVPEYDDESIRELFETPYRIVYRLDEGRVEILAVIHAARKFPPESG
jgi:plasmid stabilization system protein ParE